MPPSKKPNNYIAVTRALYSNKKIYGSTIDDIAEFIKKIELNTFDVAYKEFIQESAALDFLTGSFEKISMLYLKSDFLIKLYENIGCKDDIMDMLLIHSELSSVLESFFTKESIIPYFVTRDRGRNITVKDLDEAYSKRFLLLNKCYSEIMYNSFLIANLISFAVDSFNMSNLPFQKAVNIVSQYASPHNEGKNIYVSLTYKSIEHSLKRFGKNIFNKDDAIKILDYVFNKFGLKKQTLISLSSSLDFDENVMEWLCKTNSGDATEIIRSLSDNDNEDLVMSGAVIQLLEKSSEINDEEVLNSYRHQLTKRYEREYDPVKSEYGDLKNQLEILRKNLENAKEEARLNLNKKMLEIESKLESVKAYHDIQEETLNERKKILSDPLLAIFYRAVQNKLQQLFLGYKVIASGLVVSEALTTSQQAIQAINLLGRAIPIPGSQALAVWLGFAIQGSTNIAARFHKLDSHNNCSDISAYCGGSFKEIDELTETTARKLTLIYQEQLLVLKLESAKKLAEVAVHCIIKFLWEGTFSNEVTFDKELRVQQLISSVAQVYSENKSFLERLKLTGTSVYDDLKKLFLLSDGDRILTINGQKWDPLDVFQRPGLKVIIKEERNNAGKPIVYEKYYGHVPEGNTKPRIFGYRLATKEEVELSKLPQIPQGISDESIRKLTLRSSSSSTILPSFQNVINEVTIKKHVADAVKGLTQHIDCTDAPILVINHLIVRIDMSRIPPLHHSKIKQTMIDHASTCRPKPEDIKCDEDAKTLELKFTDKADANNLKLKLKDLLDSCKLFTRENVMN